MKNLPIWYQGVFPMVCSFFLCVSCTPDEKELDYQLSYSHTIAFPLDYESGAFPSFARLDRINGREIFGFFNIGNNQLYLYDAQTQKLVKQIAFEKEGPNGIGSSQVIGYQYLSPDSIFLFTYNLMKLFHVNESGKVLRTYTIREREGSVDAGFPDIRTLKPFRIIDGKAYIASLSAGQDPHSDHTKVSSVFIVDLKSGGTEVAMYRPRVYNEGYWGPLLKYQVYSCYNPHTERFVYSFGADHSVYETNHRGFLKKRPAPFSSFPEQFQPLTADKSAGPFMDRGEQRKYDYTSPSYFALLYDPYRRVYYRFATLSQSLEAYQKDVPQHPGVVILDEKFNRIGETVLPNDIGLQFHTMLVGEAGLYICQVPAKEDQMVFALYTLTPKSE